MVQAEFQDQHLLMVVTFVSVFLGDVQGSGTLSRGGVQGGYLSPPYVIFEPCGCWANGRGEGSVRSPVPTLCEPIKVPALRPIRGRHSARNPFEQGV